MSIGGKYRHAKMEWKGNFEREVVVFDKKFGKFYFPVNNFKQIGLTSIILKPAVSTAGMSQ